MNNITDNNIDSHNNMKACLRELVNENYEEFRQESDNTKKTQIVENIRKLVFGDSTGSSLSKERKKVRKALTDKNRPSKKMRKVEKSSKEQSPHSLFLSSFSSMSSDMLSAISLSQAKKLKEQCERETNNNKITESKETNSVTLSEGNIQQSKEVREEGEKGIEREEEQKRDNLDISSPIHHSNRPPISDNVPYPPMPNCSPLLPTLPVSPNIETVQIHDATNSSSSSKVPNNSHGASIVHDLITGDNERASQQEMKTEVTVRVKKINLILIVLF